MHPRSRSIFWIANTRLPLPRKVTISYTTFQAHQTWMKPKLKKMAYESFYRRRIQWKLQVQTTNLPTAWSLCFLIGSNPVHFSQQIHHGKNSAWGLAKRECKCDLQKRYTSRCCKLSTGIVTSFCCTLLEHVIVSKTDKHLKSNDILNAWQLTFLAKRSWSTQILT